MFIFVAATAGIRTSTGSMQTTSTNALKTSATLTPFDISVYEILFRNNIMQPFGPLKGMTLCVISSILS